MDSGLWVEGGDFNEIPHLGRKFVFVKRIIYPLFFLFGWRVFNRYTSGLSLDLISSAIRSYAPTHLLFVDYVLVFCRGSVKNLEIFTTFDHYISFSSQWVNRNQSSIFFLAFLFLWGVQKVCLLWWSFLGVESFLNI